MNNQREVMEQRKKDILVAIETLQAEGMPVTIKEVANLTGLPYHLIHAQKSLHSLMNIRPVASYKQKREQPKRDFTAAASMHDRYVTVIKDLVMAGKPMSKQDVADEIGAMGMGVDHPAIARAINSLLAARDLTMDGNGLYRLAKEPVTTAAEVRSVLMDETGKVTVLEPGQSALQIAEKLIRAGARKIIHLLPSESTTAVVSHKF
jgi:arginine repressor